MLDDFCGPPEWNTPHLFRWTFVPGGARESRCAYCGKRNPDELRASVGSALPALGNVAAIALVCAMLPRVVAMLERIAIALEGR